MIEESGPETNKPYSNLILEMEPKDGWGVQVLSEESIEHYRWIKNMSHEKDLIVDLKGFLHNIGPEKMIEVTRH